MIKIVIRGIIKIDNCQIVEEYHSVEEYNMERVTEADQGIIRTIEVILEEEMLEGICNQIKIIDIKVIQVGYRRTYRNDSYKRGRSRSRDRQYSDKIR